MPRAAEATAPAAAAAAAPAAAVAAAAAAPGPGETQSTRMEGKEEFLAVHFSRGLWSLRCWGFGHQ